MKQIFKEEPRTTRMRVLKPASFLHHSMSEFQINNENTISGEYTNKRHLIFFLYSFFLRMFQAT